MAKQVSTSVVLSTPSTTQNLGTSVAIGGLCIFTNSKQDYICRGAHTSQKSRLSNLSPSTCGVHQGYPLSPTFFEIFINLPEQILKEVEEEPFMLLIL